MVPSHILRRLLQGVVLVAGVVVANFFLIRLAPGDPVAAIAGEMGGATAETIASIRAAYGLDSPLPVQLWIYLRRIAGGDLGMSYFFNQPVSALIGQRIWATVLLVVTAQIGAVGFGILIGALAARSGGAMSAFVSILATVGYAVPVFWIGIMAIILFAVVLPVFPAEGMNDIRLRGAGWWVRALDVARHLVLPALTLALAYLAQYARLTQALMRQVLGADFIRTARAKGLAERSVLFGHAFRNAALPIITVAGNQFGNLISGALLVETVFNWPGMGRLAYDSLLRRDYPTVLGILVVSSAMVVAANLATDLICRAIDPRLRRSDR